MPEIRGSLAIAEFIAGHYHGKVIEVGAGFYLDTALALQRLGLNVVVTDLQGRIVGGVEIVGDDIFNPCEEIYRGASLLYSIRPPLEVQVAMGDLACRIGSDMLVRPLAGEIAEIGCLDRRLVNLGEACFYLFRRPISSGQEEPFSKPQR